MSPKRELLFPEIGLMRLAPGRVLADKGPRGVSTVGPLVPLRLGINRGRVTANRITLKKPEEEYRISETAVAANGTSCPPNSVKREIAMGVTCQDISISSLSGDWTLGSP
jgi:hypothetical protein